MASYHLPDRFSRAPARSEQLATLLGEVERLAPTDRAEQLNLSPPEGCWADYYRPPKTGLLSTMKTIVTKGNGEDATVPISLSLETWSAMFFPRRYERLGKSLVGNTAEITIQRTDAPAEAKVLLEEAFREVGQMGRAASFFMSKLAPEREARINTGWQFIASLGALSATQVIKPVVLDPEQQEDELVAMDAATRKENYLMERRLEEPVSRAKAAWWIRALQPIDPSTRLTDISFPPPDAL